MAWQGLSEWLDFFMRDVLAPETLDARATNLRKQYFIHGPFFFTSANRFLQPGAAMPQGQAKCRHAQSEHLISKRRRDAALLAHTPCNA